MEIRKIPISKIKPAVYNPRKDLQETDPEYQKLKKSMAEFDIVEPLVWNETTGNLVGGHQRLKILQDNGVTEVDVSVVKLTVSKEKALNIALNKISGDWDFPKLKELLEEIDTGEFDIEVTGFDEAEIERIINQFDVNMDADFGEGSDLGNLDISGDSKERSDYLLFAFEDLNDLEKAKLYFDLSSGVKQTDGKRLLELIEKVENIV